jgi:formate-dependent phosphoribosylglycinamide formyltransferase (GAR transformylase)
MVQVVTLVHRELLVRVIKRETPILDIPKLEAVEVVLEELEQMQLYPELEPTEVVLLIQVLLEH